MTPSQLSAIRARLDAATPGQWSRSHGTYIKTDHGAWQNIAKCDGKSITQMVADAELIANAPTDLRALLDEVERLRGITPQFPHYPEGDEVVPETPPRYGIRWNGPKEPLAVPMSDGYWTPWHLASNEIEETHLSYKKVLNDLSADVRKLTAERDKAFALGVRAMRHAAADAVDCPAPECACEGHPHALAIRALTDPEYQP